MMQENNKNNFPPINGYQIIQQIGKGSIGVVYLGFSYQSKEYVAIKQISNIINDGNQNRYLQKEFQIVNFLCQQAKSSHYSQFIVKYLDIQQVGNNIFIISELCYNGDLYQHMCSFFQHYTFEIKLEFILEIISGIEALHAINISHRDLKPENILIAQNLENNNYYLKITDFGISSLSQMNMQSMVGTIIYMAPEILRNRKYDQTVDIWSFGCLAHEIITGKTYFDYKGDQSTINAIKSHVAYQRGLIGNDQVESVIAKCLNVDPQQRPSASQLKKEIQDIQKQYYSQQIQVQPQNNSNNQIGISELKERVSILLSKQTIKSQQLFNDLQTLNQKDNTINSPRKQSKQDTNQQGNLNQESNQIPQTKALINDQQLIIKKSSVNLSNQSENSIQMKSSVQTLQNTSNLESQRISNQFSKSQLDNSNIEQRFQSGQVYQRGISQNHSNQIINNNEQRPDYNNSGQNHHNLEGSQKANTIRIKTIQPYNYSVFDIKIISLIIIAILFAILLFILNRSLN